MRIVATGENQITVKRRPWWGLGLVVLTDVWYRDPDRDSWVCPGLGETRSGSQGYPSTFDTAHKALGPHYGSTKPTEF